MNFVERSTSIQLSGAESPDGTRRPQAVSEESVQFSLHHLKREDTLKRKSYYMYHVPKLIRNVNVL